MDNKADNKKRGNSSLRDADTPPKEKGKKEYILSIDANENNNNDGRYNETQNKSSNLSDW